MEIKRVDMPLIGFNDTVTVKETGNIVELRHMKHTYKGCNLQKLDSEQYVVKCTGEVKEYKHHTTRSDDMHSISKSLRRLRDLLNTNVTDTKKALWVTLTYKENMQDTERLYADFKKFVMRLRYRLNKLYDDMQIEYIISIEPQGRGAWHAHCVLLFNCKAPFIENDILQKIWGHGFVNVAKLKDVDNVGAYLSAYLGDMKLTDAIQYGTLTANIKELATVDGEGKKSSKYYVKGARLKMYPAGMRIFRCSRGIKQPTVYKIDNYTAMQQVKGAAQTYEKTIQLLDDDSKELNVINYQIGRAHV